MTAATKGVDGKKAEEKPAPRGDNLKKLVKDYYNQAKELDKIKCKAQDDLGDCYRDAKDAGLNADVIRNMVRLSKKKPEQVEKYFADLEEYASFVQLDLFDHDASSVQH